jgi:aspartate kinase
VPAGERDPSSPFIPDQPSAISSRANPRVLHACCNYAATHFAAVHETLRPCAFRAVVSSAPARFLFQFRTTMALIVHKYGGTSMGSVERIKNVAKRVAKWHKAGHQMVVVPSAMSGETNRLLGLAKEITTQPSPRELDMIAATGEQVSSGLLAIALQEAGVEAVSYAGWQVPVKTDSSFTKARISDIDGERVMQDLAAGKVVVITGFQGIDPDGHITTLGRGGSDTSAVAVAAALKADECLIYTDVDGVYTTDPRVVEEARRLDRVTFEEMLEMASLGSKVLQIRSVEFAGKYQVKTRVLSSLTDPLMPLDAEMKSGTLITFEEDETMEKAVISGIAFQRDEARIAVMGVPDKPGIAYQILGPVADANIDVDMIIQNQSVEGKTAFTFTVGRGDYARAMEILTGTVKGHVQAEQVLGDPKVSKVSVVGVGMRSHVGIASTMFRTLSEEGINIQMISTSEIKISVLIDEKYMELAVRALHKAFELDQA